ncbi:hypothetical protein TSUD_89750 [Trifolium subterraneum]|uniref:Uncharacterized protein n=1 Tax=Trifolium subterraneum TaxID=3900 RepID=A0A2Z6PAF3_TRISU|nr:hypothetical protein TSUD_89750 [Trifolium subterraneum]
MIAHESLIAGKGLDRLVVLTGMDIASKFTSPESILHFREGYSLYNGDGEDELVIVETVRADDLVTTDTILRLLNVAPSQFHPNSWAFVKGYELLCYALDLEPSLGVLFSFYHVKSLTPGRLVSLCAQPNKGLFKLFASNFKNYQDSFFRVRYGPGLHSLMYDTDGDRLFPFYWTEDPRVIKGVYDDVLTSFEKEMIAFLESFNLIDIKDLLRRETNAKCLTNFIPVTDAERTVTEIKKQWADEVDRLKKTHKEALAEMRGAHGREIAELRKKHADEKASLRTKAAILEAEVTTLEVLRNNLIVSLTQSRKDISELEEDVDELEETNTALKQSMADKYVDGFWSSIEQVKILFPELDPDVLDQVDVMKRIKDGKLN